MKLNPEIQEEAMSCEAQHVALGILEAEERHSGHWVVTRLLLAKWADSVWHQSAVNKFGRTTLGQSNNPYWINWDRMMARTLDSTGLSLVTMLINEKLVICQINTFTVHTGQKQVITHCFSWRRDTPISTCLNTSNSASMHTMKGMIKSTPLQPCFCNHFFFNFTASTCSPQLHIVQSWAEQSN